MPRAVLARASPQGRDASTDKLKGGFRPTSPEMKRVAPISKWNSAHRSSNVLLRGLNADALDFPLQHDSTVREDPLADELTNLLNIGGGGVLIVDEEIAMHLGHMSAAHAKTAAARRVDEFPGAMARRIFES